MPTKAKTTKKTKTVTVKAEQPHSFNFKIGADPEFLLFYGARGLDARNLLKKYFSSKVNDSKMGCEIANVGNFGWDGASSTGELRPLPTNNINEMVERIGTMYQKLHEKLPFVDMTTLSIGSPIGGHIHLDAWYFDQNSQQNGEYGQTKEKNRVERILGTYLLPLVASDHRISAMTRLNTSYGRLNDIRYEQKSFGTTAEIRGLTAEWTTSPKIAKATLAYLAVIWHELKIRNKELIKDDFVVRSIENLSSLQKMMLADYKILETALTHQIHERMKTFELYPLYKEEIDFILKPQKVLEEKEKMGWNINAGWNLNKTTPQPQKRKLLSRTETRLAVNKMDTPDVERHFAVAYNDDFNVSTFAQAISERVAALNWRLKNEYILFGFKKEIVGYTAMDNKSNFYKMSTNQNTNTTRVTCATMLNRFKGRGMFGRTSRLDPKTGKIRSQNSNIIVVGIPFDVRTSGDTRSLIELIWNIENKKLLPLEINAFSSVNKNITQTNQNLDEILMDSRGAEDPAYNIERTISQLGEINGNNLDI